MADALETVLYTRLSGYASLTALVSTRIYPSVLPADATYPCVAFWRIGGEAPARAMSTDGSLRRTMVQVNCLAKDASGVSGHSKAADIAAQVLAALRRYSTSSGTIIQAVFTTNEGLDLGLDPQLLAHTRVLEFEVWWEES